MWSAATVLVCALDLLGRSASSFPPIVLLDTRPPNVSAQADAFVLVGGDTIFLLTSAPAFVRAQRAANRCGGLDGVRKIASVLIHEEWHIRNGPDERSAYEAQLMALAAMQAGPGTPVYASVFRSMQHALDAQRLNARAAAARERAPDPADQARAGRLAHGTVLERLLQARGR